MRKSILTGAILMMVCLMFTSCSKDDDKTTDTLGGTYKLVMGGKTLAEGKSNEVGLIRNAASISKGDFSILITSVPSSGKKAIDGSDCTVAIMGKSLLKENGGEESYLSISGSIIRLSDTKISFKGSFKDVLNWVNSPSYSFEGTIESTAYKMVE